MQKTRVSINIKYHSKILFNFNRVTELDYIQITDVHNIRLLVMIADDRSIHKHRPTDNDHLIVPFKLLKITSS